MMMLNNVNALGAIHNACNYELEWLSRDNLSSPLFALVIYRHVKNWFTHLLDRSQTTSCLDSKHFF